MAHLGFFFFSFFFLLHSGNNRSRQLPCLVLSFTCHLSPEREKNHLNIATQQCQQRELDPGRQYIKQEHSPLHHCIQALTSISSNRWQQASNSFLNHPFPYSYLLQGLRSTKVAFPLLTRPPWVRFQHLTDGHEKEIKPPKNISLTTYRCKIVCSQRT